MFVENIHSDILSLVLLLAFGSFPSKFRAMSRNIIKMCTAINQSKRLLQRIGSAISTGFPKENKLDYVVVLIRFRYGFDTIFRVRAGGRFGVFVNACW